MFAGAHAVPMRHKLVDGYPHGLDRRVEPLQLAGDILRQQAFDHDARLVQQNMAKTNAVGDWGALDRHRAVEGEKFGRLGDRLKLARGDHFGEQHRRRLQGLYFLLGIAAPHLVLNDENADGIAAAQDRDAQEGVVDLFARLRPVGEGRVLMRLGKRQGFGALGDQADEAFAGLHGGEMHRLAVEALRGVEFEPLVRSQDINRTDFGDHIGGDLHNDLVEPRLRIHRLRADFAQPAQQQAGSAENATHQVFSCSNAIWRARLTP